LFTVDRSRCIIEVGRSYIGLGEKPPPCRY
jgi:hypothetical protein